MAISHRSKTPKSYKLANGTLRLGGLTLFKKIPAEVALVELPASNGVILRWVKEEQASSFQLWCGEWVGVDRFVCTHRPDPYWMVPKVGVSMGDVPPETQYLLADLTAGGYLILVPLLSGVFRCTLSGQEDELVVVAETGDPAVVGTAVSGLYLAFGDDPYELCRQAAVEVNEWLGTGRLRTGKQLPDFVDQFGWCTWDAFNYDVSHENVRIGLESFALGGVSPRLLILDAGWQSVKTMPSGEKRLTAFQANENFPVGLAGTVKMAKETHGIETFMVWHAVGGYWGGVDGESLTAYGVRSTFRRPSVVMEELAPDLRKWFGGVVGVVPPALSYSFFQDYHRYLRSQGVDGVKIDNQASLEMLSEGFGGRVAMMQRYHEALEGSVHTHFQGAMINCMSCSNDMLYSALNSNLTRTSTDFWPNKPETHGLHLYTNAQVGMWFGEFIHPDWDMFQSGHPAGAFHAAGRAISGGPVYVSDKPEEHNFDLLKMLVLPDGGILRAIQQGKPTRDCLFNDPTREDVLLKIFNINSAGGVVGVFNARYTQSQDLATIAGWVSPADVEGLEGDYFAVYAHHTRDLRLMARDEKWEIHLPELGSEVFTITPVDEGVAPIGLIMMLNGGGAVLGRQWLTDDLYEIAARGSGTFGIWCERLPSMVVLDGETVAKDYDRDQRILRVELTDGNHSVIQLIF
jgi:raffinose synthase